MKKVYLTASLVLSMAGMAAAQQSAGGFPLSSQLTKVQDQQVAHIQLAEPDYAAALKEDNAKEAKGIPGPYMVGLFTQSDIGLSNSGTWYYLDDGSKIWRLSVTIPAAQALGPYYDHFYLPKGVKFFVSNGNGRQVLGAYTSQNNNSEFKNFVNQAVQGSTMNLEMDIPAQVQIKDIVFHINRIAAYYRSMNYLTKEYGDDNASPVQAKPTGGSGIFADGTSAACNIDANCPIGSPDAIGDYDIPKRASVRIIIDVNNQGTGLCSGTLINNTGNSANGTCVPYLLTASHCDEGNSYSDSEFSQWWFDFNFRHDSCGGTAIEGDDMNSVLTGAYFRARSNLPSMGNLGSGSLQLVGDFLLLQLKVKPNSYGTYYVGWNRDLTISLDPAYDFYINFSYPVGDVEKMAWGNQIDPSGTFNQTVVHSTHWDINFVDGGIQGGSSGSGLFDKNGRLIGDLSGSGGSICPIDNSTWDQNALYSKLGYDWTNDFDQTNHPNHAGPQSRLKDWLDPTNSGVTTLGSMMPDCTPTAIQSIKDMGNNIEIYPTPSTNGIIHVKTNFKAPTDLTVSVYSSLGRLVREFTLSGAYNGNYSFNCSGLADGLYLMKFRSNNSTATKKVLITK